MSALPSSKKYTFPPQYTTMPDANVFCPSETIAHRHRPANDIPHSFLFSVMGVNDYRAIHEMPPTTISPSLLRVARTHDRTPFDFPAYPFIHQGAHLSSSGGHGGTEITIPIAGSVMFPAAFRGQNGCLQSTATVPFPFQAQQAFALQEAEKAHNVIFNHDDLLVPHGNQASSSRNNRPTHRCLVEDVKGPLEIVIHAVSPARERKKTSTGPAASVDSQIASLPGPLPRVRRQGMRRDLQDWKDTKPSSSDPAADVVRAGAKRRLDDPSTCTISSRPRKKTKKSPPTTIAGSNGPSPGTQRVNSRGKRWDLVGFKVNHAEKTPPAATERVIRRGKRWDLLDYKADSIKTSSASTSKQKSTTRSRRVQS